MIPRAHVLYAVALLISYAATFGWTGFYSGMGVLCLWGLVFYSSDRPGTLARWVVIAIVAAILFSLVTPQVQQARESARRSTCKNNLKQIGIALHNYHEVYDSFPPAYIADEKGKPMHSWRVLLLPFLDQQQLYEKYDFNKPWDSPENLELSKDMPIQFRCPSQRPQTEHPQTTSYVAIVGPDTAWPGSEPRSLSEMTDGATNVILVLENHSPEIPWTEPRDLSLEEAAAALASTDSLPYGGHRSEDFFREYFYGRSVLFGDGRVQFAPLGTDKTQAAEAMTINDNEPEPGWEWITSGAIAPTRIKWGNVIRIAIFVILTVLPLPWVWVNPKGMKDKPLVEAKFDS